MIDIANIIGTTIVLIIMSIGCIGIIAVNIGKEKEELKREEHERDNR